MVDDGCVWIYVYYVVGNDENGEVCEVKRCVKIFEGVDGSKVNCRFVNDNIYFVEVLFLWNEDDVEIELKIESVFVIMDGKKEDM